jgi:hypothetical protein
MKNECSRQALAFDFVNGELSADEARAYNRHLAECPCCRAEVDSNRQLIGQLRCLPAPALSRDLSGPILAKVRAENAPARRARWWLPTAAAAAVVILTLMVWKRPQPPAEAKNHGVSVQHPDPEMVSLHKTLDWFRDHQEADGSWDGTKWGARPEFQVALTALPTLAILSSDTGSDPAAGKALEWLRDQQSASGQFGENGVALPFNHCLATLTLLTAYQKSESAALKSSIDPALNIILQSQIRDGGWGHFRSPYGNDVITAWHVKTLELAASLGWHDASPALERGRRWQSANLSPTPPAVATPLAHSAGDTNPDTALMDLCTTYFNASQLNREDSLESRSKLASIREELLGSQITSGADAGSWPPVDHRKNIGGRLYSTALAYLALNEN